MTATTTLAFSLALLTASRPGQLQVGVVGDGPPVMVAVAELNAAGFDARACTSKSLACVDDETCRPSVIEACDADAVVGVTTRSESDGAWTRTVVVDRDGAIAMSLDQPADPTALLPAIVFDTLRTAEPRAHRVEPAIDQPPKVEDPAHDDDAAEPHVVGESGGYPMVFWAGVVVAGAGVLASGATAVMAGIAEAERAEPTNAGEARSDAQQRAQLLWLATIGAGVVAGVGGMAACVNSDTRTAAPESKRWCIE